MVNIPSDYQFVCEEGQILAGTHRHTQHKGTHTDTHKFLTKITT